MSREIRSTERKWRFFQFRMWHVLALITIVAIPVAIYAWLERQVARQQQAITVVENFGGKVETNTVGPEWLPEKYRTSVIAVNAEQGPIVGGFEFPVIPSPFEGDSNQRTLRRIYSPYASEIDSADLLSKRETILVERPSVAEFFTALHRFGNLTELHMVDAPLRDEHTALFNPAWPLRKLDLGRCELKANGFAIIAQYKKLETLNLSFSTLEDKHLHSFVKLKMLNHLAIDWTAVSDSGLMHVGKISSLRRLDINETQVTGSGLFHLKSLRQLERLNFSPPYGRPSDWPRCTGGHAPTIGDLSSLPELPALNTLHISRAILNEGSIRAIGRQPSLKTLTLERCVIPPGSLRYLQGAPLEELATTETRLSEEDDQWINDNDLYPWSFPNLPID